MYWPVTNAVYRVLQARSPTSMGLQPTLNPNPFPVSPTASCLADLEQLNPYHYAPAHVHLLWYARHLLTRTVARRLYEGTRLRSGNPKLAAAGAGVELISVVELLPAQGVLCATHHEFV